MWTHYVDIWVLFSVEVERSVIAKKQNVNINTVCAMIIINVKKGWGEHIGKMIYFKSIYF